jgi:hypothetical protein
VQPISGSRAPKRHAAVDCQIANMQASYFKVIYGQGAHMSAFHRKRAHGETSDSERTDRGSSKRECAERDRAKTDDAIAAGQPLVGHGAGSGWWNLSNCSSASLYIIHGAPRSSTVGFDVFSNVANRRS